MWENGGPDERLEKLVYGRFLEPEQRKEFFETYKEIEALWEILSPSPELRDHIETFSRLARPLRDRAQRLCQRHL